MTITQLPGECRCGCPESACIQDAEPDIAASAEDCRRCGGPNVIWSCMSPLWNYVMRGNDINGEPIYDDLVCIPCFIRTAQEAGLPAKGWRLILTPEPEGLIYETPSGRVWNEQRFLWVDADGQEPVDDA